MMPCNINKISKPPVKTNLIQQVQRLSYALQEQKTIVQPYFENKGYLLYLNIWNWNRCMSSFNNIEIYTKRFKVVDTYNNRWGTLYKVSICEKKDDFYLLTQKISVHCI